MKCRISVSDKECTSETTGEWKFETVRKMFIRTDSVGQCNMLRQGIMIEKLQEIERQNKKDKKKKQQSTAGQFLKGMAAAAAGLAVVCVLTVYLLDPFYHYHKPWFGLKAVLNEKEYQVPGSLRHFDYDNVLVGSSVVENNDNRWYDEAFGGTTMKAVRSYGGIADLVWYLNLAFDSRQQKGQQVQKVFFNLDPSSLTQEARTTFEASGCPMYLYDRNPFNDVKYLLNKTVLLEKIPYMLAQSFSADYNEGLSYNWAEGKDFSENGVLEHYYRKKTEEAPLSPDAKKEELEANLELLSQVIEAHPDTEFFFFLPPYSMIWWDDAVRNGLREVYLYDEQQAAEKLLSYENVRFFDFQNEEEIVTDLNHYMDTVHFDPGVNYAICEAMAAGRNEVTVKNLEDTFAATRELTDRYEAEVIPRLEQEDRFLYAD